MQLARCGLKVVIMSHSQEKLKKVEDEISEYITHPLLYTHITKSYLCFPCVFVEEKYHREVVVIPVDFSDGLEIYPNIAKQLQDLEVGILSKPYYIRWNRE